MSLVVNTNSQSLFAQRALSKNTFALNNNTERLSTGSKINRAADDAAGLSITEKMAAEIRGIRKAQQNIGDGISVIQTMEGAITNIQENVQRIRELFIQAANGTNGTDELNAMQQEVNEIITSIRNMAEDGARSNNGDPLLWNHPDIDIQVGANDNEVMTLQINQNTGGAMPPVPANTGIDLNVDFTHVGGGSIIDAGQIAEGAANGFRFSSLRIAGATIAAENGSNVDHGLISDIDASISSLSRMRSYLGTAQNSLESRLEYLEITEENVLASKSRIKDTDIASETSKLTKNQILQQSSSAMVSQANSATEIALNLLP